MMLTAYSSLLGHSALLVRYSRIKVNMLRFPSYSRQKLAVIGWRWRRYFYLMTMPSYGACCIENRCQLKVEFARRHGRNPKSSSNYRLQKQQVLFSGKQTAAEIRDCFQRETWWMDHMPEMIITSPYVHSWDDSNTCIPWQIRCQSWP